MDWTETKRHLERPFSPTKLHWRAGATNRDKTKAIALAYINARDVMQRLDEVFGPFWQARYPHLGICEIGVFWDGQWIWRGNGAGVTEFEAEKGQASDAFKRAAVLWGIGRYLYYLPSPWVGYDPQKKRLMATPRLPKWATPEGYDEVMAKRAA